VWQLPQDEVIVSLKGSLEVLATACALWQSEQTAASASIFLAFSLPCTDSW